MGRLVPAPPPQDRDTHQRHDNNLKPTEMGHLRASAPGKWQQPNRSYSAGTVWIVLPALLPRFRLGGGVGSGAWVRPDLRFG